MDGNRVMAASYRIKRVYEAAAKADGKRVLVDRVWPRGISKDEAELTDWVRDVAPSTELRQWFGHKPERFAEFRKRYMAELKGNAAVDDLKALSGTVTLVYGAKDEEHNQAVVLKEVLEG
jgi:uncharacterized protein YeaO (DUF488 family)